MLSLTSSASKVQKLLRISIFLLIISGFSSCAYYKIRTHPNSERFSNTDLVLRKQTYHTVLHIGNQTYVTKSIGYDASTKSFYGVYDVDLSSTLYQNYEFYYDKIKYRRTARARSWDNKFVHQLHIFCGNIELEDGAYRVHESDVIQIDVMNRNVGAEVATITAVSVGSFALFLVIACNCPHVYTDQGQGFNYSHTLFTGATERVLERNDYKIFPDLNPASDELSIVLKNEESEVQYTNLIEITAIHHPKEAKVFTTQDGELMQTTHITTASRVTSETGQDISSLVATPDQQSYEFNEAGDHTFSNAYVHFELTPETRNAQLILTYKNHSWGGYVYDEFSSLMGRKFQDWKASVGQKAKDEIQNNVKEQGLPMVVYVKQNGAWKEIEVLELVGDVAYNTVAVKLDEALLAENSEGLEFKIQAGFMLWQLDYVALSTNATTPTQVTTVYPTVTNEGTNNEVAQQLRHDDQAYLEHHKGDEAKLIFENIPVNTALERTLILRSKGYYLSDKTYPGKVQRAELKQFNQPAGFAKYSKSLYFDGQ